MNEEERRHERPMRGPGAIPNIQRAHDFGGSMKKLIKFMKPYYTTILISVILALTASLCSIIAPSVLSRLTNQITVSVYGNKIDMLAVGKFSAMLIALYALNAGFNYIQSFVMVGVTQGAAKKLRTSISLKINSVPFSYFDRRSYGDTLSRVTNDVDTIGMTMNHSVVPLIQSVIMIAGVLVAMFATKWQMALACVLTVPLSAIVTIFTIKFSQPLFVAQHKYLGELNGHIEESFSGQNIIKLFNAEAAKRNDFNEINLKLFHANKKAQFISGLMMPLTGFISNLGYVAICVVGAILYKSDPMNMAGVIVSFFVYVRLFQSPIQQLGQAFNQLQSTAAAAERVFEFLDAPDEPDENGKTYVPSSVKGAVEFRHVNFGYTPDRTIINDFSAKVEPGMKVAIVGPTGAGKTTMVHLIMRFYELNGGEILIDGVPISDMKRETVRKMFSMVLQDTWLFEGTIRENIVYSKQNVTQAILDSAAAAANIDYFIKGLPNGYETMLDDDSNVSGGQKQLLTIARAMIQNSPMMILDEATSNVDTRTEELIQEAMDKLTGGRTSFVIAHRLSTIKNADLILVMKNGDIVEQGNHEQLMAIDGFYASLYNSQFEQLD